MASNWEETRQKLASIALRKGMKTTASEVLVCRTTLYRMLHKRSEPKTLAIRARIREVVEAEEEGADDLDR